MGNLLLVFKRRSPNRLLAPASFQDHAVLETKPGFRIILRLENAGRHRPMQWRLAEETAAETATGFKKEIRLGGSISDWVHWAPGR